MRKEKKESGKARRNPQRGEYPNGRIVMEMEGLSWALTSVSTCTLPRWLALHINC
jgi:hypothetical protein